MSFQTEEQNDLINLPYIGEPFNVELIDSGTYALPEWDCIKCDQKKKNAPHQSVVVVSQ